MRDLLNCCTRNAAKADNLGVRHENTFALYRNCLNVMPLILNVVCRIGCANFIFYEILQQNLNKKAIFQLGMKAYLCFHS
ncbi:hypothetical protein FDUTEX481_00618 [Tolypothrix sp. PCC 7601]|nr:hypothetical protein FDUTEX481_00618 [Tolypothrix sp. PCC 7601]